MIKGILIVNNHGKIRLARFYTRIDQRKQQQIVRDVFSIVSKRSDAVCNFVELNKTFGMKYREKIEIKQSVIDTDDNKATEKDETMVKKMKADRELAEFFDSKLIYRHYATLFFIFLVDQSESELGILDLIQVFVEALDQRFENVCELDIVFHYDEVNHILDEIVMGGMVLETNLNQIMNCVYGMKKYEKLSKSAAKKSVTKLKSHV
eukprot:CAMPEP_0197033342 /NCGR_PEP_ID=MMETSP1384-20130603/11781_1 /TAXON_ID=29189 /ORGANISM="Ammonia sp." /LENGTH=206 /DNA_ID=CAMNT_0042463139 /DNA_START=7 /DNA_END=627 /DNA_ORIENTATION=+